MQLPRRVPWPPLSELEQLRSWIYSDEADPRNRQLAVNKVTTSPFSFQLFTSLIYGKTKVRTFIY